MGVSDTRPVDFPENICMDDDLLRATIARILSGDPDLFTKLMAELEGSLRVFLSSLAGDPAEIEELAQQTRLLAFERLDTYRGEGSFKAWVLAIAYNVFRRSYRARKKHVSLDLGREVLLDEAGNPLRQIMHKEIRGCIQRILYHHMDETYRLPIILRDFEGLSYKEVAAVLKLSVPAVKSRLHRGRRQFVSLVDRVGCSALQRD